MSKKVISEQNQRKSIFEIKSVNVIYDEIRRLYIDDNRPWVIGYSGGKDSTTTLQLVWYAISELAISQRQKPIHIISSDTLVETPIITDIIRSSIENINKISKEEKLPFIATMIQPEITDSFWVNLIGKGYPAPKNKFRWCTDRLKIYPANRYIINRVSEYGEVILILGVRKQESMTRAQVMSFHKIKGTLLSRHSTLPQTFIYTPIEDFSTNDVWDYLLQCPNPWGNDNHDLITMYRNATGECPLVVDKTTPSCGNSRFGCWVCTVVEKDRSMEALIDKGEEWMRPLLKFREQLIITTDPDKKHHYRGAKRRNGKMKLKSDGSMIFSLGPYNFQFRKELLRKLLDVQQTVRKNGPNPEITLIRKEELEEIRKLWRSECSDWEDSVPKICREILGMELDWIQEDHAAFTIDDAVVLEEICNTHNLPAQLVTRLLDVERDVQGMARRASIYTRINKVLKEEWRDETEVMQEFKEKAVIRDGKQTVFHHIQDV